MMRYLNKYIILGALLLGGGTPQDAQAEALFSPCQDAQTYPELSGSLCAEITLPLRYNADFGDISIFVRHYPAAETPQGDIWFLAGGPGESGASFLGSIGFFRDAFPNHNLFIPDHRGTGFSSKLCDEEESAKSPAGIALEGVEWRSCFASLFRNIERAHSFTRLNAARDIATLIERTDPPGDVFIYGVSYGTSLALEVGRIAGDNITALMLDSLTPAREDARFGISYHSFNADRVGSALLKRCTQSGTCPGGSELLQNYQGFLKEGPVPDISGVELRQYLGSLLDIPHARALIPEIIDAIIQQDENLDQLIARANSYIETYYVDILKFPQSPASIPLVALISGSEDNARPQLTMEVLEEEHEELGFISPVPKHLVSNNLPLYAVTTDERRHKLPPIFVIHGTLDPKTPYEGALKHVEKLRRETKVHMMTVIDAPHGIFLSSQSCLKEPLRRFVAAPSEALPLECRPKESDLNF